MVALQKVGNLALTKLWISSRPRRCGSTLIKFGFFRSTELTASIHVDKISEGLVRAMSLHFGKKIIFCFNY